MIDRKRRVLPVALLVATIAGGASACGSSQGPPSQGSSLDGLHTLVPDVANSPLTSDATNVYWVDPKGGVFSVGKDGGSPKRLATLTLLHPLLHPTRIVVNDGGVYVTDGQSVYEVRFSGESQVVVTGTSIASIAVDSTYLYWTTNDFRAPWLPGIVDGAETQAPPVVMRMPLGGGGAATTIVSAASGTVPNLAQAGNDLLVDDTSVYWFEGNVLLRAPKSGGDAVPLFAISGMPLSLAMDATSLYFVNDAGTLASLPKSAPTASVLASGLSLALGPAVDEDGAAASLAVDATRVYVTTRDGVVDVPKQGGPPVVFFAPMSSVDDGDAAAAQIVADDHTVYWESTMDLACPANGPELGSSPCVNYGRVVSLLRLASSEGGTTPLATAGSGGSIAAAPACAPSARFAMLDYGNSDQISGGYTSGTDLGLVRDTQTGLVWMRVPATSLVALTQAAAASTCSSLGMRLPTEFEALGIAATNADSCAWPSRWVTWTSTAAGAAKAWVVLRDSAEFLDQPYTPVNKVAFSVTFPLDAADAPPGTVWAFWGLGATVGPLCVAGTCDGSNPLCACTAVGAACTDPSQCCSQSCVSGACALAPPGTGCTADATCASGSCDASTGECTCGPTSECLVGACEQGKCVCSSPGVACAGGGECCSGSCVSGACACGMLGTQCSLGSDCCTDDCQAGKCTCVITGGGCGQDGQCCSGTCQDGACG